MNPVLNNHKVYGQISDLNALMQNLYKMDSIYFAPAGIIMPTAFFKCWTWMKGESALLKHLKSGSFWSIEAYDKISRRRIRKALSDINVSFSEGSVDRLLRVEKHIENDIAKKAMYLFKEQGILFTEEQILKMNPITHTP